MTSIFFAAVRAVNSKDLCWMGKVKSQKSYMKKWRKFKDISVGYPTNMIGPVSAESKKVRKKKITNVPKTPCEQRLQEKTTDSYKKRFIGVK